MAASLMITETGTPKIRSGDPFLSPTFTSSPRFVISFFLLSVSLFSSANLGHHQSGQVISLEISMPGARQTGVAAEELAEKTRRNCRFY
jgi:hypothetical protein